MLMYKCADFRETNCTHCCLVGYNTFSLVVDASVLEECYLHLWGQSEQGATDSPY